MATDPQRVGFERVIGGGRPGFPAKWPRYAAKAKGEKNLGSSKWREEDGRKRPLVTRRESKQIGQCAARWGATSQMWQKYAVPSPLASVYFGTNVKSIPSTLSGPRHCTVG